MCIYEGTQKSVWGKVQETKIGEKKVHIVHASDTPLSSKQRRTARKITNLATAQAMASFNQETGSDGDDDVVSRENLGEKQQMGSKAASQPATKLPKSKSEKTTSKSSASQGNSTNGTRQSTRAKKPGDQEKSLSMPMDSEDDLFQSIREDPVDVEADQGRTYFI